MPELEISLATLLRNPKNDQKLYLVPHVPSKFWDLRSWYFPRTQHNVRICVSSEAAYKAYQDAGFDAWRLLGWSRLVFIGIFGKVRWSQVGSCPSSRDLTLKIAYFADYSSEITARHIELLRGALTKNRH